MPYNTAEKIAQIKSALPPSYAKQMIDLAIELFDHDIEGGEYCVTLNRNDGYIGVDLDHPSYMPDWFIQKDDGEEEYFSTLKEALNHYTN